MSPFQGKHVGADGYFGECEMNSAAVGEFDRGDRGVDLPQQPPHSKFDSQLFSRKLLVRIPFSLNDGHALDFMRRYARTNRFVERFNVDPWGDVKHEFLHDPGCQREAREMHTFANRFHAR